MSNEDKKEKRSKKQTAELPEKFKTLDADGVKREVTLLEEQVAAGVEQIRPAQAELKALKDYLAENKLDCQHEKLAKMRDNLYECEVCKLKIRVRIR